MASRRNNTNFIPVILKKQKWRKKMPRPKGPRSMMGPGAYSRFMSLSRRARTKSYRSYSNHTYRKQTTQEKIEEIKLTKIYTQLKKKYENR